MVEGKLRERRKHKRVPVARPATAVCGARMGEVVDASMSGMAILHQGPAARPGETTEVSLHYGAHSLRLPVEVVWDRPLEASGTARPGQRRCGLVFRRLGRRERFWLEHFLWSQTDGWPEIPIPDDLV
ncbi:MAG: PilZ domain-containing protein [Desulfobacteraceae bacterium]|nr:PilZ domain-containing protein [Desulfobacteraceae bacterium]